MLETQSPSRFELSCLALGVLWCPECQCVSSYMYEFPRKHLLSSRDFFPSLPGTSLEQKHCGWLCIFWQQRQGVVINYFFMLVHIKEQILIGGFGYVLLHILIYISHMHTHKNIHIHICCMCKCIHRCVCVFADCSIIWKSCGIL